MTPGLRWSRIFRRTDSSRGGRTTRVHALTEVLGRPYAFELTAGNVSDTKAAGLLPNRTGGARHLLAGKDHDANSIRKSLCWVGIVPFIPGRINRKRKIACDKARYREQHPIKNAFCRIKDFRRVATRYDRSGAGRRMARRMWAARSHVSALAVVLSRSPAQALSAKTWGSRGKLCRIAGGVSGTPSRTRISAAWVRAPAVKPSPRDPLRLPARRTCCAGKVPVTGGGAWLLRRMFDLSIQHGPAVSAS